MEWALRDVVLRSISLIARAGADQMQLKPSELAAGGLMAPGAITTDPEEYELPGEAAGLAPGAT
jgi:hypothetical protein